MNTIRHRRLEPPDFAFPVIHTAAAKAVFDQAAAPAKLVTVTAPTGYGKTVFLTELYRHLAESGFECIWLSVDEALHSTEDVLTLLEGSFLSGGSPSDLSVALHESELPVERRMEALIEAISMLPNPAVLLLDNISYCEDETFGRLLDALVFHTPSWFHIVLGGTREPPLSTTRAKLEGKLKQLDYRDLAMDTDDVALVFGDELCGRIGMDAVASVARHTEGWPAAVRLMQIILSEATNPLATLECFSGSDEDIAAMLKRQVLAVFDEESRAFLLKISGLRSFCVDLCEAATGDARAGEHVAELLRRNVLVIPLDRNRRWFRLHGLFREFLLGEARRELAADTRVQIWQRAARWCEQEGALRDAMEYLVEAGDWVMAAALIDRTASRFVRDHGDLNKYIEWVEQLREAGQELGFESEFWYVWALMFHRRYDYARLQLEGFKRRIADQSGEAPPARDLHRRVGILTASLDIYTDHLADARDAVDEWLAQREADDPFDVATVACMAAIQCCAESDFHASVGFIRTAQASIKQSDSEYGMAWVSLLANLPRILQGEFAEAAPDLRAALQRARARLGERAGMVGTLALTSALCEVETGEATTAQQLLRDGLSSAHTHGILETAALGLEAGIKIWDGSEESRYLSIAELREIAAGYPPRLASMLSCFLTQRLLRLGRIDDARLEARQIGLGGGEKSQPPDTLMAVARGRTLFAMTEIELLVHEGHLRQAEPLARTALKTAVEQGRWAAAVELELILMHIAEWSHNPTPAASHLTRAVSLAAKRRIFRPFLDRLALIAGLVNETKPQSWAFTNDEERQFFGEICARLPNANSAIAEQLEALDVETQLLESPTAREMELLALIEAGLSNQQLADRLSVSVSTVKWHLYNLYTKLGVSSRSAAVAKARALNLLTR